MSKTVKIILTIIAGLLVIGITITSNDGYDFLIDNAETFSIFNNYTYSGNLDVSEKSKIFSFPDTTTILLTDVDYQDETFYLLSDGRIAFKRFGIEEYFIFENNINPIDMKKRQELISEYCD